VRSKGGAQEGAERVEIRERSDGRRRARSCRGDWTAQGGRKYKKKNHLRTGQQIDSGKKMTQLPPKSEGNRGGELSQIDQKKALEREKT